jgi:hypothetical protein
MSRFEYTLPSGARFQVNGPAGATQLQADLIFYEQVAAGSLVGYEPGQTLTSAETQLIKFDLSRLDRGTAGVDTAAILSIVQSLPVVSGIPNLINVPVQDPIDQADIVLAKGNGLGPVGVGPLNEFQVQTLQAQLTNLVDQPYDAITNEKGIGKFGFNCYQLEKTGYVKPGTSARLLESSPEDFVEVMNSPAIWTGAGGVNSLDDLLQDPNTQNLVQTQLMQTAYDSLVASGVISNVPTATVSLSQGQIYTPTGLQTVSALNLLGGNAGLASSLLSNPVTTLSTISSGTTIPGLENINLANATAQITSRINGSVGALIFNASKFGTQATAAWAQSGGLGNNAAINSLITSTTANFGKSITTLTGTSVTQLTNLVPGSVGNLKSTLDTFGKASQFSLNFANPLDKLKTLDLQAQGAAALTNLQTQGAAALNNLQTQGAALAGQLQAQGAAALNNLQAQGAALAGQLQAQGTAAIERVKSLGNLFSGSGDLVSGTKIAAGFNNTVNRKTVDAAVVRILGNSKIPVPGFEYPSAAVLAERLDIAQAQNILQGIRQQGAQVLNQVNQIQTQATRLQSQATQLAGQASATFNRLTG